MRSKLILMVGVLFTTGLAFVAPADAADPNPSLQALGRECMAKQDGVELTSDQRHAVKRRCDHLAPRVQQRIDSRGVFNCVVRFGDAYRECLDRVRELQQRSTARSASERSLYRTCTAVIDGIERTSTQKREVQDRCDLRARRVHAGLEPSNAFGCVARADGASYRECLDDRRDTFAAQQAAVARLAAERKREADRIKLLQDNRKRSQDIQDRLEEDRRRQQELADRQQDDYQRWYDDLQRQNDIRRCQFRAGAFGVPWSYGSPNC